MMDFDLPPPYLFVLFEEILKTTVLFSFQIGLFSKWVINNGKLISLRYDLHT